MTDHECYHIAGKFDNIKFDNFMINDACIKLNSVDTNIYTSAKFVTLQHQKSE